jgi:hypothetical protein
VTGKNPVKINTNPVAGKYYGSGEQLLEYSSEGGGGHIAFRLDEQDGKTVLTIDMINHDPSVVIRVGEPRSV